MGFETGKTHHYHQDNTGRDTYILRDDEFVKGHVGCEPPSAQAAFMPPTDVDGYHIHRQPADSPDPILFTDMTASYRSIKSQSQSQSQSPAQTQTQTQTRTPTAQKHETSNAAYGSFARNRETESPSKQRASLSSAAFVAHAPQPVVIREPPMQGYAGHRPHSHAFDKY